MRLSANWAKEFDGVHLLAPSYLEQARRELPGRDTQNFFAVPHFTDTARFRPPTPSERAAARARFQLPEDTFVIVTIGPVGQVSGKRLEFLAEEVAAAGSDLILVSAGVEEDGAAEVRRLAHAALKKQVRFLGPVDRALIHELLWTADVYSLGSLAEPFSIAILEALAIGLPVVHHQDPVMMWQTGPGGAAVSMTTPGAAAEVFRTLHANPDRRLELARNARELAEKRYAPNAICQELAEALLQIHARRRDRAM
jgi:UDP-glucose:(heptosyl)LPS alpha-1,3-glucosyltransferase